jgi:hypothetical protein
VATTLFLDETGATLSGLIFVRQHVGNLAWKAIEDFGLLHNSEATTPLRRGALPVCCEMWVDHERKLVHRGRCAEVGVYAEPRGRRAKAAAKARAEVMLDPETEAFVEGHMRGKRFAEAEAEYDAREALRATPIVKLAERLADNFAHFARELANPNLDEGHRELYARWARNVACADWDEEPTKSAKLAHVFRAIRLALAAIGARHAPPSYLHIRRVRLGVQLVCCCDEERWESVERGVVDVNGTTRFAPGVRVAPYWRALVLGRGVGLARDWRDRASAWCAKQYEHAADVVIRELTMLFPDDAPKVSRADLARALEEWSVFEALEGRTGKFNAVAEALKETSLASTLAALESAYTNWKNRR